MRRKEKYGVMRDNIFKLQGTIKSNGSEEAEHPCNILKSCLMSMKKAQQSQRIDTRQNVWPESASPPNRIEINSFLLPLES